MSNCIIPNWNLRYQRQEEAQEEEQAHEGNNRSSHVQSLMSNYGIAELTWENGQPAMHGHGDMGICQDKSRTTNNRSYIRSQDLHNISKPTWDNTNDSLESIVHQATYNNKNIDFIQREKNEAVGTSSMVPITGKWEERVPGEDTRMPPNPVAGLLKKRVRSESDQSGRYFSCSNINQEEHTERSSTCASASARFCRDNNNDMTTMMTWPSESWRSVKTKTIDEDHDSASHGGSDNKNGENNDNKRETSRSHMTRSSRAAAVHNQSERRRRDRINQKMKALQKMVPNASKTDKASMLDEVIAYLKHLQAQIHMISNTRNMPPQMMIPPAMLQQQLQMSVLARMGMAGMAGMGMLDMNNMARNAPVNHASMAGAAFAPAPPFPMPQAIPTRPQSQENPAPTANSPVPYNPYYAFLAQSMNMDLYSKMAALFQQQPNQSSSTSSQANHVKRE